MLDPESSFVAGDSIHFLDPKINTSLSQETNKIVHAPKTCTLALSLQNNALMFLSLNIKEQDTNNLYCCLSQVGDWSKSVGKQKPWYTAKAWEGTVFTNTSSFGDKCSGKIQQELSYHTVLLVPAQCIKTHYQECTKWTRLGELHEGCWSQASVLVLILWCLQLSPLCFHCCSR